MRWIAFTTLIVTPFGIPVPALAQDAGRPWVAARVLWDVDLTWTDNDPSGVAGGFSLGADFSRRLGVEFAADWPQARTTTSVTTSQDRAFGLERVTRRVTHQTPSWSGAVLIHVLSTPRVRVSALAGLAFLSRRSTHDTLVERVDGSIEPVERFIDTGLAPVLGLESSVILDRHVAIAPEIRVIPVPFTSTAIIRPGIGLRWMF